MSPTRRSGVKPANGGDKGREITAANVHAHWTDDMGAKRGPLGRGAISEMDQGNKRDKSILVDAHLGTFCSENQPTGPYTTQYTSRM